jgi:hypothetical protein
MRNSRKVAKKQRGIVVSLEWRSISQNLVVQAGVGRGKSQLVPAASWDILEGFSV